jgi:rod shape-determining protein MreD
VELITERQGARLRFTVLGSLIAFLLQVMIAPNIAILDVVPNFILGFVVLNAMLCNSIRSSLTGFILGLLYDFIAQGPLGIMALALALVGYSVSSINKELFTSGWPIQAVLLLVAAFFGELLHAAFLSISGYDPDFLLSIGMRVVPGALYDAIFGLIVFPLIHYLSTKRLRASNALKTLKGKFD